MSLGDDMKTILDLIGEFSALNDAKVVCGGELPPESEKRWAELKSFYDLLMASRSFGERLGDVGRVSPSEVMARVLAPSVRMVRKISQSR